jgi:hydrogenase maturation protease
MPAPKVRVLGLGNVLMGDDAVGPWVIEELLANWEFPPEVEVVDVGTPGLDLVPYVADADTILIVDTVKSDGPPGRIRVYERDQLFARPAQPRLSPHDPGLTEVLFALTLAGSAPRDVVLIGVVPEKVEKRIGLSPLVQDAVPQAAAAVIERLRALGFAPHRRADAIPPSPWWEDPEGSEIRAAADSAVALASS